MKLFLVLKNVQINREPRERTWNLITMSRNQPKLGKKPAKGRRIS